MIECITVCPTNADELPTRRSRNARPPGRRAVRARIAWFPLLLGLSTGCDPMFRYRVPERPVLGHQQDGVEVVDCGLPTPAMSCRLSSFYFAGEVWVRVDIANVTAGKVRLDPARAQISLVTGQVIAPNRLLEAERDGFPPSPYWTRPLPPGAFTAEIVSGSSMARTMIFPSQAIQGPLASSRNPDWQSIRFVLPIDTPELSWMIQAKFEAESWPKK